MDKYKAEKKASQEKALRLQQEKAEALRAAMSPEDRVKADKRARRLKFGLIAMAVSFALILAIGIFTDSETSETSSSPAVASDNSGVNWSNYSPTVKTRIEGFIQSADCSNLQKEFDIADQNNAAQRNRVGTGTAELMGYIDSSMRKLDCY
jgi:hypothetical protein